MSDLPLRGAEIGYNGVAFPVETDTVEASFQPIQDPSKRTTAYVVTSLTLKAYFGKVSQAINGTVDATVTDLVQRLTTQGGAFTYEDVGLGNLSVNLPGTSPKDVIWGPTTKLLKIKAYGTQSCDVVWTVQVARPYCDNATFEKEIMSWSWKMSVAQDKAGSSRRVFSGHLEIPQTRRIVSDRRLYDSADAYLERVLPALVKGFRRQTTSRALDETKNKLDFEVTDEEMGVNYPPPGVVDVEVSHSVETVSGNTVWSCRWQGSIRGKYEMARGAPVTIAWQHFLLVLRDRLHTFQGQTFQVVGGGNPNNPNGNVVTILPKTCSLAEKNAYDKTTTATFTWSYHFFTSLANILTHSGLFREMPWSDWERWSFSLRNSTHHPRGSAKLKFDPAGDSIVDLCVRKNERILTTNPDIQINAMLRALRNGTPVDPPPPGASWQEYVNFVKIEPHDNTVILKTMPTAPVNLSSPPANIYTLSGGGAQQLGAGADDTPASQVGSLSVYPVGSVDGTIVQVGGRPQWVVWMVGRARRAGYPIPPPNLISVGGRRAIPQNQGNGFAHGLVGNNFGVPMYAASWKLRYVLDGEPQGDIPVTDSPFATG